MKMSNYIEQPATQLNSAQQGALNALLSALSQATDCGLFDEMAAHSHPDRINAFCDDLDGFAVAEGVKAGQEPSQREVSNYIEQTALSQDKSAGLRALNCAASLSNGLLTLDDGTSVELADLVDFVKGVASKVIPSSNDAEHDLLVEVIGEAGAVLNQSGVRRILSNYIDHPASGKTGTFAAKYDQHAERNGQTFTVLGAVDPSTYDADECGEMFTIRFADGVQIDAWPEEVQSAMNVSNYIEPSTMSAEAKSSLVDGEVLGQDADGGLIQWNGAAGVPYNSGQTVEEFGVSNLSEAERKRLNLSNYIESSPSRASGHTAYEATEEDVENVLRSNSLAVANTNDKSFESMANELHGKLNFDLIEQAALAGDDLDEQTDYANDEIARQLREMGVLEPLQPAYDSPSPGM